MAVTGLKTSVLNLGGQIVSTTGNNIFVNGVGVSVDIGQPVYITGAQTIVGAKTFSARVRALEVDVNGGLNTTGEFRADENNVRFGALGNVDAVVFSQGPFVCVNIDSDNSSVTGAFLVLKDNFGRVGATELMRVNESGNMGVGTATPQAKIHANGSIRSEGPFESGSTNLADIFYPRNSNPSGFGAGGGTNYWGSGSSGIYNLNSGNNSTGILISPSGISFPSSAPSVPGGFGFRNRVINGDMRIDQRREGTVTTGNAATFTYNVDRFAYYGQAADGVVTIQRTGVAPSTFTNSLGVTVTTADASIGASQLYLNSTLIEGSNISDLDWGLSTAKTVTFSFWVRSSVTGTYAGGIVNGASDRSYVFTYVINAANTWERKTITISGDTSGTWLTTSGIGIRIYWSLGSGTTFNGTANTWQAGNFFSVSGATQLISTLGATWYVTGVQFELGNAASEFERLSIANQLQLCQRYYEKSYDIGVVPGTNTNIGLRNICANNNPASYKVGHWTFAVSKRTTPTVTTYSKIGTGTLSDGDENNYLSCTASNIGLGSFAVQNTSGSTYSPNGNILSLHFVASAEL